MYYISKYKRDNGKDAIPGPGARFSGPAHPGWPKFNLTRSGQRPAGWKEECIIFCVIRGITKPARSLVPVYNFLGWPTRGDPNSTSPVRTGDQRDRRKNILDLKYKRDNGREAIPVPGVQFSGPAHPGWPEPNLTRSHQKPAGWKAALVSFPPPKGRSERAGVPVVVFNFFHQHQLPVLPKREFLARVLLAIPEIKVHKCILNVCFNLIYYTIDNARRVGERTSPGGSRRVPGTAGDLGD